MAIRKATEVFHDWALKGKDEGMEKGHSNAVSEMLDFVSLKKQKIRKKNSLQ